MRLNFGLLFTNPHISANPQVYSNPLYTDGSTVKNRAAEKIGVGVGYAVIEGNGNTPEKTDIYTAVGKFNPNEAPIRVLVTNGSHNTTVHVGEKKITVWDQVIARGPIYELDFTTSEEIPSSIALQFKKVGNRKLYEWDEPRSLGVTTILRERIKDAVTVANAIRKEATLHDKVQLALPFKTVHDEHTET